MKIIDLLNKIANGEEVPKKIKIGYDVLIHNEKYNLFLQDYYYMTDEENATWKIWAYRLNDEVEILEEEKKMPEKIEFLIDTEGIRDFRIISPDEIAIKVNEIIDYLDYLKSKGE